MAFVTQGSPPSDGQVREFVGRRFGQAAAASLVPAGAGEWSRAFAFRAAADPRAASDSEGADERDLVIRFGRHRTDFAKDRLMGELVRTGQPAAGCPGGRGASAVDGRCDPSGSPRGVRTVPIPRVRQIGDTPWGHFVTAERCIGTPLDELDGPGMRAVLPDLLRTLDAIADLEPTGPGYGSWDERGAARHRSWRRALLAVADEQDRTAGWRALLDTSPGPAGVFDRALGALDESLARLEPHWPDPAGPRRIVHADLLNRNVLVAPGRSPRSISAVLDWGNALYGDPLYDHAWLLFWSPWYPAWSGIDIGDEIDRHLTATGRRPDDLAARLLAYQLHIGLDSLTYNALTRRWANLDRAAGQLDDLLGRR